MNIECNNFGRFSYYKAEFFTTNIELNGISFEAYGANTPFKTNDIHDYLSNEFLNSWSHMSCLQH